MHSRDRRRPQGADRVEELGRRNAGARASCWSGSLPLESWARRTSRTGPRRSRQRPVSRSLTPWRSDRSAHGGR